MLAHKNSDVRIFENVSICISVINLILFIANLRVIIHSKLLYCKE